MPSVVPPQQTLAEAFNKVELSEWLYMLVPLMLFAHFTMLILTVINPKRAHTFTVGWFVLSGYIHSYLELSFTFFRDNQYFGGAMDLYSASDYRYGYPMEEGTAAMETITALLDGPLCLLAAYAFVTNKSYYHPVALIVSIMQLYGLTWFCLHPLFSEHSHVSSDPGLFWVICVGMNMPWSIFPSILAYTSFNEIVAQFERNAKPAIEAEAKKAKKA
ncbi:hypothetical protein SDRG_04507 [Saprolegnia diclina VS20]|uniref:EXPERA domain-containing protein n=1 Tax=Saprolegnia diclina (strain VS20) TaxID=1156394 RepID=T0S5V3_SAPDV|nr:hypothetical protein SDRG_04507 [Saprolegnia diclina VS20]EQC38077.1 hypothetical protein SDRG_04507 [Saprolegnia diclina VS20]|eukprot:XP_008608404.1 hypothetical protein SDRG_04507 [Saprolegnia diclina VS20]